MPDAPRHVTPDAPIQPSRVKALLALLLIAPAPSVGVLVAFYGGEGALGVVLWAVAKVWLFGLPVAWRLWVDRQKPSLSPMREGGLAVGAATGLLIAGVIIGAYFLFAHKLIDADFVRAKLEPIGLTNRWTYLAGVGYWVLINSVLEEYVYRWFIFRKCETLMPKWPAVALAAAIFVVHHAIAVKAYFDWLPTILVSLGIFIGGALWSWMYLRYRSIWPGYLSHALVDIGVFVTGWIIIFG
ncbi:MAG: CPBP family intramembrane metalloprotease [Phycisphaera sp.]|nr:CPBP family intramembrane metalloprotease [Phycisphaera sp.]